jgi:hypothetical protein
MRIWLRARRVHAWRWLIDRSLMSVNGDWSAAVTYWRRPQTKIIVRPGIDSRVMRGAECVYYDMRRCMVGKTLLRALLHESLNESLGTRTT